MTLDKSDPEVYRKWLEFEVRRLKDELAECRQALEDVCIGAKLPCSNCGEYHPCKCDK